MKKIFAMMLVVISCCLMLAGCGDSKYVGKYTAEMMGQKATLELKDDHKASFMGKSGGKWEVKDDKIVVTSDDSDEDGEMEFTINDDGDLELTESGITVTFEKED